MGAWIGSGSRDEAPEINGISHFVEHMVFKGTTSRSARSRSPVRSTPSAAISTPSPARRPSASTSRCSMSTSPRLWMCSRTSCCTQPSPLRIWHREQGVILEEIKMDEDNPDYLGQRALHPELLEGRCPRPSDSRNEEDRLQLRPAAVFDFYAAIASLRATWSSPRRAISSMTTFVAEVEQQFSSLAPSASHACPPPRGPALEPAHHPQAQEVARAGAALPWGSCASRSAIPTGMRSICSTACLAAA